MKRIFASSFAAVLFTVGLAWSSIGYCGEFDQGKSLYQEKCMLCHGTDGKGDGPAAAALSPAPQDFRTSQFWGTKDVDQLIATTVKNGKGQMPAFGLGQDEIKAIIAYMTHAFKK